ncbi:hypothetical protein GCM10010326_66380 [Streptomyces xanthochromogenes]|uniref:Uncharacterized protein n=1 Tax=Streptomyces xanthochromogenes TaxID=67384 RepID=A0ABQ3AP70_9ACTN|nr:hypothetical protein GCM10010326_66380 [Streptomyces xanthochromogenes]
MPEPLAWLSGFSVAMYVVLPLDRALAVELVKARGSARSATGAVMARTLAAVFLVFVIVLSSNYVVVLRRAMTRRDSGVQVITTCAFRRTGNAYCGQAAAAA